MSTATMKPRKRKSIPIGFNVLEDAAPAPVKLPTIKVTIVETPKTKYVKRDIPNAKRESYHEVPDPKVLEFANLDALDAAVTEKQIAVCECCQEFCAPDTIGGSLPRLWGSVWCHECAKLHKPSPYHHPTSTHDSIRSHLGRSTFDKATSASIASQLPLLPSEGAVEVKTGYGVLTFSDRACAFAQLVRCLRKGDADQLKEGNHYQTDQDCQD